MKINKRTSRPYLSLRRVIGKFAHDLMRFRKLKMSFRYAT